MNRLTLISVVTPKGAHTRKALYRCACGAAKVLAVSKVQSGHTQSCGCLRREMARERATVHGHYREPEYTCWKAMIARCSGIGAGAEWYRLAYVCERWLRSYAAFLADVGRRPSPAHSLDRIDPAGDYEPGNVRWADRATQSRNTKNHRTNTSGVRGVTWSSRRNKWRAAIYVNNRQVHLGYHAAMQDAAEARAAAEKEFWK